MKKWPFLFFLFIIMLLQEPAIASDRHELNPDTLITKIRPDTLSKVEDKVIDEVIESKKPVKEKVEYLSEVTKYGFKNLFKNYSYNSAIPYSSQVNPFAENYMQDYLKSHENYLLHLKETSMPYFNFIDGILVQYGLPKELKYLAVIESNLKTTALSSAGALGPWQFMSYTARGYGLVVNQYQDDRTDYFKSTNAAAKYLLKLYRDLKDWLLVIAAYNGGPGRVYSAIEKSGSRNFWKLQYYLPEESRNHVKKFIATHYIMETGTKNNAAVKFNYSNLSNDSTFLASLLSNEEKANLVAVPVSGRYISGVIARNVEMEEKDFNRYNPGFDEMLATGASYNLQLPSDKMALFHSKKYQILDECVEQLINGVNADSKSISKETGKKIR